MSDDKIPACVCTAHPPGDDRRKYMRVAECNSEFVTFCCQRCTEITGVATVQVRTLKYARERAAYIVRQQRQSLDPRVMRMLAARKRGGATIKEAHDA